MTRKEGAKIELVAITAYVIGDYSRPPLFIAEVVMVASLVAMFLIWRGRDPDTTGGHRERSIRTPKNKSLGA